MCKECDQEHARRKGENMEYPTSAYNPASNGYTAPDRRDRQLLSELLQAAKDALEVVSNIIELGRVTMGSETGQEMILGALNETRAKLRDAVEKARKLSNEVATSEGKG